jgi:hypothetical protein
MKCEKCHQPIGVESWIGFATSPITGQHIKCPNLCPDCKRPIDWHYKHALARADNPCTRTYESLVGEGYIKASENLYQVFNGQETQMETELQLLVIDLWNNHCVAKAEKGRLNVSVKGADITLDENASLHFDIPLSVLREAIDQKPVPRIEYRDFDYHLIWDESEVYGDKVIGGTGAFDALSEIVGKPLPIWKGGEWTQISVESNGQVGESIGIWRYKR